MVIKLRNLGDVVLTVPVFRALKDNFLHAHIAALVNSGTEEAIKGLKYIDEIIVFNRKIKDLFLINRLIKEVSFIKEVRNGKFDVTIDLTSGDRGCILSFFSGAKTRIAYDPKNSGFWGKRFLYSHLIEKDETLHVVLQNLNILRIFGISSANTNLDFYIPEHDKDYIERVLFHENKIQKDKDKIIHIHPVARWLFKCWKDEYMAEIISWLIDNGVKVIITSSRERKEIEKIKKILNLVSNKFKRDNLLDLSGKTNIKQLAAISLNSDIFFGVDSAPMHIAAAVGTPVVALFGPTDERHWGPWGKNHTVIRASLSCMPCKKGSCEGILPRKCMVAIEPKVVKKVIEDRLNDRK